MSGKQHTTKTLPLSAKAHHDLRVVRDLIPEKITLQRAAALCIAYARKKIESGEIALQEPQLKD